MKLLLTSVGPSNDSLRRALLRLLGRPFAECSAVHIPTAAYGLEGGGLRFAAALGSYWAGFDWKSIGQLELTALPNLPAELWLPELQAADVILVGGGTPVTSVTGFENLVWPTSCLDSCTTLCTSAPAQAA